MATDRRKRRRQVFSMRRRQEVALSSKEVDPLILHWIQIHTPTAQIEEIRTLAAAVMEDEDKAVTWLSQPNVATDNRPPIELIGKEHGFDRVKNLLMRIEYGVLA